MEGVEQMELVVFGEINAEKVLAVQSGFAIAAGHKRSVRLWICSVGGDVGPALALHDLLARRPEVAVIATGECQSAALIAFLGASRRLATPNVIFLNHEITGVVGFPEGLKLPAIARLRGCPMGFFDSEEALEAGIVQEIYQGDPPALPAASVGVN